MELDGLSYMLGWVSIACWIVVYSPQIIENYRRKSGEGLSVPFVLIWLTGDLFNVVGAVMAGLIPTVIIIGLYYSFCDLILLCQIYYYRWIRQQKLLKTQPDTIGEESPLLDESRKTHISGRNRIAGYVAAIMFVCATGVVAWWISGKPAEEQDIPKNVEWRIQIIGWLSAILYLSARIPQILKNVKTRCEGLAPALFLFAILGNSTYALSICAESMERNYLIKNSSWLAGSALTVFLDAAVLCQFIYYRTVGPART